MKAEDYKLIPMSEITDEARRIAVLWMECEDKNWIGQKHKLASDIMNYARQENARLTAINEKQTELIKRFLKGNLQIPIRDYSLYQKLNNELFSLQAGEEKKPAAKEMIKDKCTCQIADKGSHSNFCKRCKKHTY